MIPSSHKEKYKKINMLYLAISAVSCDYDSEIHHQAPERLRRTLDMNLFELSIPPLPI
jgi:hypothetical protein